MNQERRVQKKPMVEVNFVQADFFLNRISEFERKYSMPWQVFVAEYSTGELPGACQNTDFAEWDFLCNNFAAELLKPLEASPPVEEQIFEGQKPEAISGFFICGRHPVGYRSVRRKSQHCPID